MTEVAFYENFQIFFIIVLDDLKMGIKDVLIKDENDLYT
jgi:hypothetical protein